MWVDNDWATVDLQGPPGDPGIEGVPGQVLLLPMNGVEFTTTVVNPPDAWFEPTGLTVVGTPGAEPCMTILNSSRLSAVKSGVYAISITVWLEGGNVTTDANNWIAIDKSQPVAGGISQVGLGDIEKGNNLGSASIVTWLTAGEYVVFTINKHMEFSPTINAKIDIRAVILQ